MMTATSLYVAVCAEAGRIEITNKKNISAAITGFIFILTVFVDVFSSIYSCLFADMRKKRSVLTFNYYPFLIIAHT